MYDLDFENTGNTLFDIFLNKNGLLAAIDAERLQKELEWLDIISLKA